MECCGNATNLKTKNMSDTNVPETNSDGADVLGMKPNTLCMLLHLSQLLNFCAPPCGIVVPIVLWALGKDKSPQIDQHGKIVLNWIVSSFIYLLVIGILCIAIIGFLLVPVLLILMIVFPVIGAVKANEGTVWKYPFSISFFK